MKIIKGLPPKNKYEVLIRCNTYNQSKYIVDTLNGFAIQQTNFPFLVYVIDDASTDGEQEVLKNWVNNHCNPNEVKTYDNDLAVILMAKDKNNENCVYAIYLLKKNLFMKPEKQDLHKFWREQCDFEALCEGDDYWIDSMKLQKQVNYMHSNQNCSLCFTGAKVIFDNGFEKEDLKDYQFLYKDLKERDYDGTEILENWLLPYASIMIRCSVTQKIDKRFMFGDIIIGLSAAECGKVHCLPEKMVVYRRNSNGMSAKSQPLPRVINHYKAIAEVFGDKYKKICNHHIINGIASSLLTGDKAERKDAVMTIIKSPSYLPKVFLSVIKICIIALYKRIVRL